MAICWPGFASASCFSGAGSRKRSIPQPAPAGRARIARFTVIATLLAHGTRGLTGEKRQQQETTAFEHLAIVGGFLFVVIHGAGRMSVDNLLR
jgi:uncharacterized membrane protein YphA (DoxX/SURF4 family)